MSERGGAGGQIQKEKVIGGGAVQVVDMISGSGRGRLHDAVGWAAERTQIHAILHVVLLQLGEDVFPVGVLPQSLDVGPDLGGGGGHTQTNISNRINTQMIVCADGEDGRNVKTVALEAPECNLFGPSVDLGAVSRETIDTSGHVDTCGG